MEHYSAINKRKKLSYLWKYRWALKAKWKNEMKWINKWKNSDKEREIPYNLTYGIKKKKKLIDTQVSQACGYQKQGQGRKKGDRKLVEDGKHTYTFNDN